MSYDDHRELADSLTTGQHKVIPQNELPQGCENVTIFSTGSVRSSDANNVRFDLITPVAMRRLAETYSEGSKKYGDHNWTKGMPVSQVMNHALRHLYLWLDGDKSEDHLAHATWNLCAIMHFEEKMPSMIDIPARTHDS